MSDTIGEHIASLHQAATRLHGQEVTLTTRRGQQVTGELWQVGRASCQVGVAGRFAYGGVTEIRAASPDESLGR